MLPTDKSEDDFLSTVCSNHVYCTVYCEYSFT